MTFDAFNEGVVACRLLVPAIDLVSQHLDGQCLLRLDYRLAVLAGADCGHYV